MPVLTMVQPFSEWLQALMDQRGAGNNKLARYLGVSPTSVSRWRSGEDIPDPPNCHKVAAYFEREPEEVMARAGHLERTEAELRRPAAIAELKVLKRRNEEDAERYRRLEQDLLGDAPGRPATPQ